jgi:N-acetylmuramoyl-L-alanine amidase
VFKIFKQEDLKEALEGSTPLPFKIGYASQLNESVLMSCTRKDPNTPQNTTATTTKTDNNANNEGIIYKVQFLASMKKIPTNDKSFNGIDNVSYYIDNNTYKYTSGSFKSDTECQATLAKVRALGFDDAFIVKFNNGKRIK